MAAHKKIPFSPYSNTVTVLVLAILLAALAITIRSMQQQTSFNQFAASGCINPPPCAVEHKCFIEEPKQGWCPVTPPPLSPTPSIGG